MMDRDLARLTLAAVWLGTAAVSVHDGGHAGAALLGGTGTSLSAGQALAIVWLASAWDGAVGLALLLKPGVLVYRAAALSVIGMTVVATLVMPALWLDPSGPLLKNLPLLVLLRQLVREGHT